jgi:large subunit ribosomal protein L22
MFMQYQATSKYIRMSPRKVRLVADTIRGMNAIKAAVALAAYPKRAAEPVMETLKSAIANAKGKQAAENLTIALIDVTGGPALKRWHAVSKGSAHGYKKKMTHLRVVLTDGQQEESKKS